MQLKAPSESNQNDEPSLYLTLRFGGKTNTENEKEYHADHPPSYTLENTEPFPSYKEPEEEPPLPRLPIWEKFHTVNEDPQPSSRKAAKLPSEQRTSKSFIEAAQKPRVGGREEVG